MRQESLYRRDAVARAHARGLMQFTVDSARRTARKRMLLRPALGDLFDLSTNLVLGAAHLEDLLDQFHGL